MPRNGSGTYSAAVDFTTEAASPPIEISKLDQQMTDIGTALTASIASDGQTQPSADLPMNGNKHTNCAAATALTEYARVSELIDQDHIYYVDSGSANTYAITPNPAISAYEEGQKFTFRATNTNTGASTLNVNAKGATAIQTMDGNALVAGMIVSGGYYECVYDSNGSRFVLVSPASAPSLPNIISLSTIQTFALADAMTIQQLTGSTTRIWTIPTNASVAFQTGTMIVTQALDTAEIDLNPDSGVTLTSVLGSGNDDVTVLAGGTAILMKVATNEWTASGDIVPA